MARASTTISKRRKSGSKSAAQLPEGRSKRALDELCELFVDSEKKMKELRWWFNVGHQVLRLNPTLVRGEKATEGLARSLAADKLKKATDTQSTRILGNTTFALRLAQARGAVQDLGKAGEVPGQPEHLACHVADCRQREEGQQEEYEGIP